MTRTQPIVGLRPGDDVVLAVTATRVTGQNLRTRRPTHSSMTKGTK